MLLTIAARASRLSRIQVSEVYGLLTKHFPEINFEPSFVSSPGDRDQQACLQSMDKSDFFTRDVDQLLLKRDVRIAIHSAKDLPEPLPKGLKIVAITEGVSKYDALVFPTGKVFATLPENAVIGVSSDRREDAILEIIPDADCYEIRGTVENRIEQLENGDFDAIVVAEAALIRLGIRHLYRLRLPGETASLQGQLAIVANEDDREIEFIFSQIDSRRSHGVTYDTLLRI
ncbi:MAG: hydroxymethylbilane synthase [Simkaniaceae bacterium]|nr:hydroxymethylbilane synthase [Simkaniaceae bacterium]